MVDCPFLVGGRQGVGARIDVVFVVYFRSAIEVYL